jgi:O-antigen/teichoic acid export membrane protein
VAAPPHRLGRSIRHAAIARTGSLAVASLGHVLAIRWLGAAGYGEYVIAEAWVFALGVLALWGNHLACFTLAEQERRALPATLLVSGVAIILALWCVQALAGLAAVAILPAAFLPDKLTLAIAGFAVLGLALYRYISELLRLAVSVELANYFSGRGTGFVSTALFGMLVVGFGCSPVGLDDARSLLLCYAVSQWAGAIIGLVLLAPVLREPKPVDGPTLSCAETCAALWERGRSIVSTQGLQLAMGNIDIWILGALASPVSVGIYGLAKRFANWLVVPAGLIGMSGLRQAVGEYLRGERVSRAFENEFRSAIRVSWYGTAAIVAAAAVVPLSWLAWAGGEAAAQSRAYFVALGLGQLLRLAFGNGGLILTAAGFEAENFRAFLCGSLIALVAAPSLIPWIDAWGAAAAFSLGTIAASLLVSRACSRRLGLDADLFRLWRAA